MIGLRILDPMHRYEQEGLRRQLRRHQDAVGAVLRREQGARTSAGNVAQRGAHPPATYVLPIQVRQRLDASERRARESEEAAERLRLDLVAALQERDLYQASAARRERDLVELGVKMTEQLRAADDEINDLKQEVSVLKLRKMALEVQTQGAAPGLEDEVALSAARTEIEKIRSEALCDRDMARELRNRAAGEAAFIRAQAQREDREVQASLVDLRLRRDYLATELVDLSSRRDAAAADLDRVKVELAALTRVLATPAAATAPAGDSPYETEHPGGAGDSYAYPVGATYSSYDSGYEIDPDQYQTLGEYDPYKSTAAYFLDSYDEAATTDSYGSAEGDFAEARPGRHRRA